MGWDCAAVGWFRGFGRMRCMRGMRMRMSLRCHGCAQVRGTASQGRSVAGHGRGRLTLQGQGDEQQDGQDAFCAVHIGHKIKPFWRLG
jgi:hypothetical protein